ncbi:MAG TPA: thiolase family protein [bacterium]|nr:thiolase family protein [bacterium]
MSREAVIVSAARTAIGRAKKGTLKDMRADDMAAVAVNAAIERAGIKKEVVEDLILGCAMPEASMGMNIARVVSFAAGLPIECAAATVNRFCSSGLESIAIAAERIMAGWNDVIIAGGAESMTMVPMGGYIPELNLKLATDFPEAYCPMGITAENVASRYGITREMQDEFAYNSHMKAVKAINAGVYKEQIVPLNVPVAAGPKWKFVEFKVDEAPRADTTIEGLAKLKPVFRTGGSVTAGNSSPMNDGAAAVVVMSKEKAKELGCKPLATFRFYSTIGTHPDEMGVGPLYAIRKLMQKTGMKVDDIDNYEINEAFASQAAYCCRELKLNMDTVNINGGAIALGHPLGCTGAKLSTQLLYTLNDRKMKYGVVSMCIGGGMGAAGLFEREEY